MTHDRDDEPKTIFEWERRFRKLREDDLAAGTIAELPPLPKTSPWSTENAVEPTINREEDGLFINREEDQSDG
jgi:hypothetical protein